MGKNVTTLPDYAYVIGSCAWCVVDYLVGRRIVMKRDL
jgi:hypothetical protein